MDYEIRPWTKKDIEAVYDLEIKCFRSPWSKKSLMSEIKNKLAYYSVAVYENKVIGYAGMWLLFDEAHVTNIAVEENFRKNGIGKGLLLDLMKRALLLGATNMTLEVRESNIIAQKMYANLGFEKEGFRLRYYEDTGEGALLLWNHDIALTVKNKI